MRIHTSDKFIAWSALLSGLTVSAVAIYYSVAGLVAIFSAAVIPIIVMGVALEISKLAGTVWLKQNWTRAPYFIRAYLLAAIAILMLITSMGIFGFLSKAHSDQSLVSGDVQSRIAIYDEKIRTAKDNIDANRKALKQMDEAVDQVMGRSSDEKGADKAVAIRRAQQKERIRLQSEIVVFDPLAVILLLASQYSFQWFRKQEEDALEITVAKPVPEETEMEPEEEPTENQSWPAASALWPFPSTAYSPAGTGLMTTTLIHTEEVPGETQSTALGGDITAPEEKPAEVVEELPLEQWNKMIEEAEKAVEQEREVEDSEILASALETEKQAMTAWKHDNPDSSLKFQRQLLDRGIIDHLPWQDYLKPKADFMDDAAIEAKKWADENPDTEESEKAKEWAKEQGIDADLSWMEKDTQGNQIKKVKEVYQQNAEQNEKTLWQRIQGVKSDK